MANTILEYVRSQSSIEVDDTLFICQNRTESAEVLVDVFKMFKENYNTEIHFRKSNSDEQGLLNLSMKDLLDFTKQQLELNEQFQETEYLHYLLRKIFARYQTAGRLNLVLCR